MRTLLTLALSSMIGSIALPAAARPLNLPPASAPKVESVKHTINGVRRSGRGVRRYVIRRHPDDLCSIVNGWRAFPLRSRYGFFDTHRVPCCRCQACCALVGARAKVRAAEILSMQASAPARILEIISPAGFERYFEELLDLLPKAGPPDPKAIASLAERYGLELDFASLPQLAKDFGVSFGRDPNQKVRPQAALNLYVRKAQEGRSVGMTLGVKSTHSQ